MAKIKKQLTTADGEPQCQGMIRHEYSSFQCNHRGSINRDGVFYCGIHDPVALEERRSKRRAARSRADYERKVIIVQQRNQSAREAVLEFLSSMRQDAWLAETLAQLSGIVHRGERARQFIELAAEHARQWVREPMPKEAK